MSNACPSNRPLSTEFASFYESYVRLVDETNILRAMSDQSRTVIEEWRPIDEEATLMRHAPYTWSLREVIGHLTDGERIFGYRALRFSRGDTTELSGFEENDYVRAAQFDRRSWSSLIEEFQALRRANVLMLSNLPAAAWMNAGVANGNRITVHALAYIIVGHVRHHNNIIRKRLGKPAAALA